MTIIPTVETDVNLDSLEDLGPTVEIKKYVNGMKIEPGFYEIPEDIYHSRDNGAWPLTLNSSTVKILSSKSPLHAYHSHPQLGGKGKVSTKAMDIGSIAHSKILGTGKDVVELDFPNFTTNAAKAARQEAVDCGFLPILKKDMVEVSELVAAFDENFRESEAFSFFLPGTHSELVGFFYIDKVLCQMRLDRVRLSTGEIWDVKTTSSANPEDLTRKIEDFGYDIQSEFYIRGLEYLLPNLIGETEFTFLFIESSAPYGTLPVQISRQGRLLANKRINRAVEKWAWCLKEDNWPGYGAEIKELDPPSWVFNKSEMAEYSEYGEVTN